MDVKLTNGTARVPWIHIGLPQDTALALFGEAAAPARLFNAAHKAVFWALGRLDEAGVFLLRPTTPADRIPDGWRLYQFVAQPKQGRPNAPVIYTRILDKQWDSLIVEGHRGRQPVPNVRGAKTALRNEDVAVAGKNEFWWPALRAGEPLGIKFTMPSNWLRKQAVETVAEAVAHVVSAPEPARTETSSVAGGYTITVPAELIERMLMHAVRHGRSVLVDKTNGSVLIE